jgi:hypothetical protein
MKNKLLSNWNFLRLFYFLIGLFIIVQSVMDKEWFGVIIGGYFTSMGLFALGCAGQNCYIQPKK